MGGFFDISHFPPRWHCGDWSPELGWLTIISDLAIFSAYTAIPITIALYVRAKRDVPFPHVFWLFSAFIFACGTTHLIEAVIFWFPIYPVQAVVKVFTAAVSIAAVLATAHIMPKALAIPGIALMNQRLQQEVAARATSQDELLRRSRELESSEARLLAAQAAARIGDWSYDPRTQAIAWSAEVFRLFQRDPQAGPPRDLADNLSLYTEAGARGVQDCLAEINAGATRSERELEVKGPAGSVVWHRGIMHADRDQSGVVTRVWGTVQDITREKSEALAQQQQRQELERINRELEQFAYIASHDLLEPLRKIRFFADLVNAESVGRLTPDGEDALRRMAQASERMSRLVKDLLSYARAGKSLVAVKAVSLTMVVKEAIENCDASLKQAAGSITVGTLPEVPGDHLLLVQVFQNLIANAVRYRHPDRPPQIEIAAAVGNGVARLSVRDNGIGLPADHLGRLFEPFVRLHPHMVGDGTGIGLAICRRIVEAHGGHIVAVPRVGEGAEFTVTLPLHKANSHGS